MNKNEPLRFSTANVESIPCRTCANAIKGGIRKGFCKAFEQKPDDVYFENAPCSGYISGEDLLKYEIEF